MVLECEEQRIWTPNPMQIDVFLCDFGDICHMID